MMRLQPSPYPEVMYGKIGVFWPENSPISERSIRLINNKRVNDTNFWQNQRAILAEDLKSCPIEYFRSWASTLIIPLDLTIHFREPVMNTLNLDRKWLQRLTESWIGVHPILVHFLRPFDDADYSMLTCLNMNHLIGTDIYHKMHTFKSIVELGGGYGGMSHLIRQLGFEGSYTIFDFPEMNQLQDYYLKAYGINDTNLISSPDNLQPADLVIATWSLTEMPFDLRTKLVEKLKDSKHWLIVAEAGIFGFDNYKWVEETFSNHEIKKVNAFYKDRFSTLYYLTKKLV